MSTLSPVLVMGFGPFLHVHDNPAERLARALDGRVVGDVRLVGRVMPVSYRRAADVSLAAIEEVRPIAVLGIGVATGRLAALVERWGVPGSTPEHPDVDGQRIDTEGPVRVATHAPEALAEALGIGVSDDAGRYVCNAWIHAVVPRAGRRAGFLHVPEAGFDPDRLAQGLAAWARG